MDYKTVLGLRYGAAFAVLAAVLVLSGWRTALFCAMPLAVVCSLGAPATKRSRVLFVLGWVVYLGGVCWIVGDSYKHMRPRHSAGTGSLPRLQSAFALTLR